MTKYIRDYNVSFLGSAYDDKTDINYTLVIIEKFDGNKPIMKKSFYFTGEVMPQDYLIDTVAIEAIIDRPNNTRITLTKEVTTNIIVG